MKASSRIQARLHLFEPPRLGVDALLSGGATFISVLSTSRDDLVLRALTPDQAADYYDLVDLNRDHLTAFGDYQEMRDATLESVTEELQRTDSAFGVWLGARLIGRVDLVRRDEANYVLGYWLDSSHTGHGYATSACEALIEHARTLGATDIWAGVTKGNTRSENVLTQLGFGRVGDMGSYTRFRLRIDKGDRL